jgi:hypothetical protein
VPHLQRKTEGGGGGQKEEKGNLVENEKRYYDALANVIEERNKLQRAQAQYDRIAMDLQGRLDEKEFKVGGRTNRPTDRQTDCFHTRVFPLPVCPTCNKMPLRLSIPLHFQTTLTDRPASMHIHPRQYADSPTLLFAARCTLRPSLRVNE